jgi:hypothetical protein
MRLPCAVFVAAGLSLATIPGQSAFGGETLVSPFDSIFSLHVIGHPPLPNDLGGLAIRPEAPDRLLISTLAQSSSASVWSVGLVRDGEGHIVGLSDGPPQFEFDAGGALGGLYGSLAVQPNGTILFPTAETNQIGEVLPGHTAPDLLIPVLEYGLGGYPSALLVNPPGWCSGGRMIVFSALSPGGGQSMASVELIPTARGLWLIGAPDPPPQSLLITVTGAAALPDNCRSVELGHLVLLCENFNGRISAMSPNPARSEGGLLEHSTYRVVVEGIFAPRGMTVDPVTGDLVFIDRDSALPTFADRVRTLRFVAECDCPADIDRNGSVAGTDLAELLAWWGSDCIRAGADINFDGVVDAADLAILLADWGPCPG